MGKVILKWFLLCIIILFIPYIGTKLMSQAGLSKESEDNSQRSDITANADLVRGLSLDDYIIGVLAATVPTDYEIETMKAQAIIIRTLVYYQYEKQDIQENALAIDTIGLDYINPEVLKEVYDTKTYNSYMEDLENAVYSTGNLIVTYEGEPIKALFHELNTGKTRSYEDVYGEAVPYLVSVESGGDLESPNQTNTMEFDLDYAISQIKTEFNIDIAQENFFDEVSISEKDSNGYVTKMVIGGQEVSADAFQKCFVLNSMNFYIEKYNDKVRVVCKGTGSGLGFSQYGANCMAAEGHPVEELLQYYYTGVQIIEQ